MGNVAQIRQSEPESAMRASTTKSTARNCGRYVTEFEHRWNTRKMSDHERVVALVAGAKGKRLTYRPLGQD